MKAEEKRNYHAVHMWLSRHAGKPSKCINGCKGKKKYEWCLKKGMKYEHKVENFQQMCTSCHRLYDMTEEKRMKNRIQSRKLSPEQVQDVFSRFSKGEKQTSIASSYGIHQTTISYLVRGKTYAR